LQLLGLSALAPVVTELSRWTPEEITREEILDPSLKEVLFGIFQDYNNQASYGNTGIGSLTPERTLLAREKLGGTVLDGVVLMPDSGRFHLDRVLPVGAGVDQVVQAWNEGNLSGLRYFGDFVPPKVIPGLGIKASVITIGTEASTPESQRQWVRSITPKVFSNVFKIAQKFLGGRQLSSLSFDGILSDEGELNFNLCVCDPSRIIQAVGYDQELPLDSLGGGAVEIPKGKNDYWLFVAANSSPIKMIENISTAFAAAVVNPSQPPGTVSRVARQSSNLLIYGETDPWVGLYKDSVLGPLSPPANKRLG